jgi:hypothetical protein
MRSEQLMWIKDMNEYRLYPDRQLRSDETVSGYFSDHNVPINSASNWSELKCTETPPTLMIMDQRLGPNDGLRGMNGHSETAPACRL